MDALDGRLIDLFATEPRLGVLEACRRLGVARGTVQARLDKLASHRGDHRLGARPLPRGDRLPGDRLPDPRDPPGLGRRGGHDAVAAHLAGIPEVLEAYTITGAGDMWARVVARSNADLQRVIDLVLDRARHRPLDHGHRAGHADPLPGRPARAGRRSTAESFGDGRGRRRSPGAPRRPRRMAPSSVDDADAGARDRPPRAPGAARPRAPVCSSPLVTAYAASSRSRRARWPCPPAPCVERVAGADPVGDVEVGPRRLDHGERERLLPVGHGEVRGRADRPPRARAAPAWRGRAGAAARALGQVQHAEPDEEPAERASRRTSPCCSRVLISR